MISNVKFLNLAMWIGKLANWKTFAREASSNVKTHDTNNVGGVSYYKWLQRLVLERRYTSTARMDFVNETLSKLFYGYHSNAKVWVAF